MAEAVFPKKRRVSKLKQRRIESKQKAKQQKQQQKRDAKQKVAAARPIKSSNDMYPECKPLSNAEQQYIVHTIKEAKKTIDERIAGHFGKEKDDGCIEYKWKLVCPKPERIQHLVTQMRYRLTEGNGSCMYQIGVEDCGNPKGLCDDELIETIKTIYRLNKQLDGRIEITVVMKGKEGNAATLTVDNKSVIGNRSGIVPQQFIEAKEESK